jgi:hypothetical protein
MLRAVGGFTGRWCATLAFEVFLLVSAAVLFTLAAAAVRLAERVAVFFTTAFFFVETAFVLSAAAEPVFAAELSFAISLLPGHSRQLNSTTTRNQVPLSIPSRSSAGLPARFQPVKAHTYDSKAASALPNIPPSERTTSDTSPGLIASATACHCPDPGGHLHWHQRSYP